MICDHFQIKKQIEVLFIIIIAIWALSYDYTPSELTSNLEELWKLGENGVKEKQVPESSKYLLAFVIFVRAYTSRLFLCLYVINFWPAICGNNPHLFLPWLFVGFLRSILTIFITMYVGCYTCLVQKGIHSICVDFIFAQFIDHGPPVYAWFLILSYYKELKHPKSQKTKSQLLQTTETFNLITDATFTNMMLHLKPLVVPTRSLDTLLTNNGHRIPKCRISDNCKLTDFVKKVLNISDDDIHKIKESKANKNLKLTYNKAIEVSELPVEEEKELICLTLNEAHEDQERFK